MSVSAALLQARAIAEVSGLIKTGRGLAVFLIIAAFAFLVTRHGRKGIKNTGPLNYAGSNYIIMLYLRWVFLAIGCLGVLLLILGLLLKG